MKDIRKDIFGIEPEIGDMIVYNPVKYKGLVYGKCIGFVKSGLPEIEINTDKFPQYIGQATANGNYTPKTGFVIINY